MPARKKSQSYDAYNPKHVLHKYKVSSVHDLVNHVGRLTQRPHAFSLHRAIFNELAGGKPLGLYGSHPIASATAGKGIPEQIQRLYGHPHAAQCAQTIGNPHVLLNHVVGELPRGGGLFDFLKPVANFVSNHYTKLRTFLGSAKSHATRALSTASDLLGGAQEVGNVVKGVSDAVSYGLQGVGAISDKRGDRWRGMTAAGHQIASSYIGKGKERVKRGRSHIEHVTKVATDTEKLVRHAIGRHRKEAGGMNVAAGIRLGHTGRGIPVAAGMKL